jgi:hypothetical protein
MKQVFCFFFILISLNASAQRSLDGIYQGVQPKYWTLKNGKKILWKDTERKNHYWYSLMYIKIRGDSVFLDESPVTIYKQDTMYSASDGGFYYYTGIHKMNDSLINFSLRELYCDYCGIPKIKDADGNWVKEIRYRTYNVKQVNNDLIINGSLFKKIRQDLILLSEGTAPKFWTDIK